MTTPGPITECRDAMLACLTRELPPEIVQWRDHASVERDMAAMLDEQLDWCINESFAEVRARRIGIGEPRDYLQRVLDVNGSTIICGIRFANLNPQQAFVELIAWADPSIELVAAAKAALEAHRVFKPRSVRCFRAGLTPPPLPDDWQASLDHVLCAETLATITAAPPPPNVDRVALVNADLYEAVTFAVRGYEALAERSPEVAEKVEPEDRDELEASQQDGRLAWWHVDGERAGLIAVKREQWLGLDGYLMYEEVVDPAYAGRHTASAAQRAVAEDLAADYPQRVLFGTIDGINTPSRRTARRVGRREIAAWWFLRPS